MKLQNKETGEIRPAEAREDGIYLYDEITEQWYKYELDLLAKWWEYYEEPKGCWIINILGIVEYTHFRNREEAEMLKETGNRFETREEAEKAVERLKAFKRLKDKGFKFRGHDDRDRGQLGDIVIYAEMPTFEYDDDSTRDDLDLLFGGEE